MSRPLRFWVWTILACLLFAVGAWRLENNLNLSFKEALLYAGAVAIGLWVIGLRVVVGGRGPLPARLLRNPHLATPEEFEYLCAQIFKKRGYKVELTPSGGDYGADVIARKKSLTLIISAKRYEETNSVGNRWVQQLVGAMPHFGADGAVLMTTSRFTKQAIEQAENCSVELIDGEEISKLIRKYWL